MTHRHMIAVLGVTVLLTGIAASCSDSTDPVVPPVLYSASLSAANERQNNPVNSTATGLATFALRSNDSLDFVVTVSGLTGPATLSHIHVGSGAQNGPVVNGFTINSGVSTGTVTSGTIVLSKLVAGTPPGQISGDSLRVLINNGNGYVNVHTSAYQGGEVRGQIVKQ
jgi:hypothetical protein